MVRAVHAMMAAFKTGWEDNSTSSILVAIEQRAQDHADTPGLTAPWLIDKVGEAQVDWRSRKLIACITCCRHVHFKGWAQL